MSGPPGQGLSFMLMRWLADSGQAWDLFWPSVDHHSQVGWGPGLHWSGAGRRGVKRNILGEGWWEGGFSALARSER